MATKRIKDLTSTATAADLVSGNYLALDGSTGTEKLPANIVPACKIIDRGSATVATINALTFKQNGWTYFLTDSGILSSGTLSVVAGDTVVWDEANSKWRIANKFALAENGTNKIFVDAEDFDFAISDDDQNVILGLTEGHIKTKKFDSRVNSYFQKDFANDFALADDNDNMLVEFSQGHIKTKNFDSRNFSSKLAGKKISILGDSISTYAGYIPVGNAAEYNGSNHGVSSVEQTWWKRLLNRTGAVLGINESWAGSGVSGTDDGVKAISTSRLTNLGANGNPDIIIIQVGTNDVNKDFGNFEFWKLAKGETYTTTKFFPAYSYIVEKLLTMYSSRIICMSPIYRNPAGWANLNGNNTYGNTMTEMAEGIKKIAETYHVDFIPLDACGINVNNYLTYLSDNRPAEPDYQVHPNPLGFELMTEKIYNELKTMSFI